MKTISIFACWLAAVAVVQADPDDVNTRRATVVQPAQVQPQVAPRISRNVSPRSSGNRAAQPAQVQTQAGTTINRNLSQRFYGNRNLANDKIVGRRNVVGTGNVN